MLTVRPHALIAYALTTVALVGLAPTAASAATVPTCSSSNITVESLGGPNFAIDSGSSPEFRSSYTGYRISNNTGAALSDVWVQLSDFTGGSLALASGQAAAQRAGDVAASASMARYWYLTASTATESAQKHTITVYRHNPTLPDAVALCSTVDGFASVQGTLAASANKVTGISVTSAAPNLGSLFTVTVTGNTGTIGAGVTGDSQSLWMSPAVAESWPASVFRLVSTSLTISPNGVAAPQTFTDTLRVAGLGSTARDYTARYTFQAIGFSETATTVRPVQEISSGTQVKHTGSYSVSLPAIQPPVSDLTMAVTGSPTAHPLGGGTSRFEGTINGTTGGELDSFIVALPSGAAFVPGTATWGGVAIDDPTLSGNRLVFTGPFVVGDNTLTIDIRFDGTSGTRAVTLTGTVGTTVIGGTVQPTDGSNPASATVNVDAPPTAADRSVTIPPNTPVTVNVANLVNDPDGDPWTLTTGTAEHGSLSIDGRVVTYTPDADFTGLDAFTYTVNDGRGGSASATVSMNIDPAATRPQSITFGPIEPVTPGATFAVASTASSGLPVVVTSETPLVCTTDGTTVTALTAGTCILTTTQPGDGTWSAAEPVTREITVNATPQTIDFTQPEPVAPGATFAVAPTASSGLPVVVTSETPLVCTTDGTSVSALAAGTCILTATQPGNATVAPASAVTRQVTITKPNPAPAPVGQTLTFDPPRYVLGLTPGHQLDGTATSKLPVTYKVTSGACALDGDVVIASAAGSCTIKASQAGNAGYEPAEPVTATITFIQPGDDTANTDGDTAVNIDVLRNDPNGVVLDAVTQPANGTSTIADGSVRYTPNPTFRGIDTFTYTVTRGGRAAQASVRVTVANMAPRLLGTTVGQLAGTTQTVTLDPVDPNADPLTVDARTSDKRVKVRMTGTTLSITALPNASGNVAVTVRATDTAGATTTATVTTRITPPAVTNVVRTLAPTGTTVRWAPAPTVGALYETLINGKVACRSSRPTCTVRGIAGPLTQVSVRTVGLDDTASTITDAPIVGHGRILMVTVYFDTDSAVLTKEAKAILADAVRQVKLAGFGKVSVDGYTDADGNWVYNNILSRLRTRAVAGYLNDNGRIGSDQGWYGERSPAASNTSRTGKAKNRRVEVVLSY